MLVGNEREEAGIDGAAGPRFEVGLEELVDPGRVFVGSFFLKVLDVEMKRGGSFWSLGGFGSSAFGGPEQVPE